MRMVWLCLGMWLLPLAGHAQQTPITYQKERIILHPTGSDNPDFARGVLLQVDVRHAGSSNPDWLQLAGYQAGTGTLELFPSVQPLHIAEQNIMSPVDVIAINEYGSVVAIAPALVLGALERPIERGDVIKAILYTKAGLVEQIGLTIGDRTEYKHFISQPTIMDMDSVKQQKQEQAKQQALEEKLMQQILEQEQKLPTGSAREE